MLRDRNITGQIVLIPIEFVPPRLGLSSLAASRSGR
jgi:hypothetical protein